MGLFASIRSKIRQGVEWIKEKAHQVKEKVTNVWNKFTGKEQFDQAERLYEQITERYNSRRKQFETDIGIYTDKIEAHVNSINKSKVTIKTSLFPEMARKMKYIQGFNITKEFPIEEYISAKLSFDEIRAKTDLYKIDFNNHKFKTTFQAIFTLGFYTRKKAKETLYSVQEEEKKVDNEIAKMDAEIVRIKAIEAALANVKCYFDSLIDTYKRLLIRLDSSVNYLYVRCMKFAHKLIREEMQYSKLPKVLIHELEALMSASEILKEMTNMQIVDVGNDKQTKKYSDDMKKQYQAINNLYEAA